MYEHINMPGWLTPVLLNLYIHRRHLEVGFSYPPEKKITRRFSQITTSNALGLVFFQEKNIKNIYIYEQFLVENKCLIYSYVTQK